MPSWSTPLWTGAGSAERSGTGQPSNSEMMNLREQKPKRRLPPRKAIPLCFWGAKVCTRPPRCFDLDEFIESYLLRRCCWPLCWYSDRCRRWSDASSPFESRCTNGSRLRIAPFSVCNNRFHLMTGWTARTFFQHVFRRPAAHDDNGRGR